MTTVGSGSYRYEVIENWATLPTGWTFGGVSAVATDSQDRVYAFQRGDPPILVFDKNGTFLGSWGSTAMPMVPVHAGPRSERMLPNRLDATTTSDRSGCATKCAVTMSMWNLSHLMSGQCFAIVSTRSSQYGIVIEMPFDLIKHRRDKGPLGPEHALSVVGPG